MYLSPADIKKQKYHIRRACSNKTYSDGSSSKDYASSRLGHTSAEAVGFT